MTLREYLTLPPWTIVRSTDSDDEGEYIVLEVAELPGFAATGRDDDEVAANFWSGLELFLQSYLDDGEIPPLPAGWQAPDDTEPVVYPGDDGSASTAVPRWDQTLSSGELAGVP